MRRFTTIFLAALATAAFILVLAGAPRAAADGQTANPSASAGVVRVDRVAAPRRKVVHRHFTPWARPTPRQVREIIRAEAHRWRIAPAALARRVACESRFRWWASNGSYVGVLQFSSGAFHRGLRTIHDRRVVLVRVRSRVVHDARIVHYADGRIARRRGRPRRQQVVFIYKGRLPRRPSVVNAWAQLRIGSQAIRGISAVHSSEWSCGA